LFKVNMDGRAIASVSEVLRSGYIGQGPKVDEFERSLESVLGAKVLTVNSCTSAIDLALHLIGVGPSSEVITTPMTCTATNSGIVNRGARVVWADVDPVTGEISPEDVARKVTEKTKAIMAVDWSGLPADYDALRAAANGVPIVEDAAHAFLAEYRDKPVGQSGGDYVAWSFQAIKHLTCGDGGALKVPEHQYERAVLLRWYGLDRRSSTSFRCAQNIREVGYKYHMNDINASIGLANLDLACRGVRQCRANASFLISKLKDACRSIIIPKWSPGSSWWLFCILTDRRDEFIQFAADRGIEVSPVHRRNDVHDGFHFPSGPLRGLDHYYSRMAAIPCGWWLSPEELEHVAGATIEWDEAL